VKILVTGHKGFIGSNMMQNLIGSGHEVDGFEWGEELPDVQEYEWVIHLGAITSTTEKDVEKVLRQNYDFSVDLYNQCAALGVNFQYASSASVYGLNKEFKENSPVDPKTPYAWSKYLFERYVEQVEEEMPSDITIQGFRYFNVWGPGEDHKKDQASPYSKFAKQAQENGTIKLFENSQNYCRDFIHVDDIIDAHKKFLNVKESGIWNLGSGKVKSFYDVAMEVAMKYNCDITYIPMPENLKSSYQEYTCADLTKLNRTLNAIQS
jgi:ADP-L-glycero-D-manno-heptose 6-epimerase